MVRDSKRNSRQRRTNKEFFEEIIQGNTISPISLNDFRRYLEHKEHSYENLDFYKWYLTYCKRFNSLPLEQRGKSPPPTKHKLSMYHAKSPHNDDDSMNAFSRLKKQPSVSAEDLLGDDRKDSILELSKLEPAALNRMSFTYVDLELKDIEKNLSESNNTMDQPFRNTVDEAIKKYFSPNSDTEVNISSNIRTQLLKDAKKTTNPEIFENAISEVLSMLVNSSIPNFRAAAVQNIAPSTVMWRIIRTTIVLFICCGVLIWIFASRQEKWYRATVLPVLAWVIISYITNVKGVCLVNQFNGKREVLDFEEACDISQIYTRPLYYMVLPKSELLDKETDPRIQRERYKLAIMMIISTLLSCGALFASIMLIPR
ncbi:hypothetical protein K7432_009177 [Basidiobolus ranarum]|uniref:RGS domain-containing protein n=1 Tax=Basidiobolus ranarum TaxID=34480 RepID=A0ABR2WQT4_9FUNG